MDVGIILCEEAKVGKNFFRMQQFKSINRQPAHVWTGIVKRLDQWSYSRSIANLAKRPRHYPVDLSIFQKRYKDRNSANVFQIPEKMCGVVSVRCDLSFNRPVAPPACLDLLVSVTNGLEELSRLRRSRGRRLNWQIQRPRCLEHACPCPPSKAQAA